MVRAEKIIDIDETTDVVALAEQVRSSGEPAVLQRKGKPIARLVPLTAEKKPKRPDDRILHVTTFSNPMQEMDKLHDLYDSLAEARRQSGERHMHPVQAA